VFLHATTQRLQQSVNPVDLCLKFQTEADAATRLLSFQIDASAIVASAPGAGGLCAIAFHLASFTEFTSARKHKMSVIILYNGLDLMRDNRETLLPNVKGRN
jgi:hypothetical protein